MKKLVLGKKRVAVWRLEFRALLFTDYPIVEGLR